MREPVKRRFGGSFARIRALLTRYAGPALAFLALATWVAFPIRAQEKEFVAPDVPTLVGGTFVLPWQSTVYEAGIYVPDPDLNPPGSNPAPEIDALHRLANPGQWLFSLKAGLSATDASPDPLAVAVGASIDPRDVVRYDGDGDFSFFFCGATVNGAIPPSTNVDAIYLDGDEETGGLVLSYDVHTTIGGVTYEPADLVKYTRTGGTDCSSWQIAPGPVPEFDARDDTATRIPSSANVIGASKVLGRGIVISLDVPVELTPSAGPTTYGRNQLAVWDGSTFSVFEDLAGWPVSSQVNALSLPFGPTCPELAGTANPADGLVDTCLRTWRTDAGDMRARLEWRAEDLARGYNVYRGSLSELDSFALDCLTPGGTTDLQLALHGTPEAGEGFFYLAAMRLDQGEGSLGKNSLGQERINPTPCP